jgi:hypothetical protein
MLSRDLRVGARYALKLRPRVRDEPLHEVELVALVGRGARVKVRHCGGELAGLEEFVFTRQVLFPWTELRAVLRDLDRLDQLQAASVGADPVVAEAAADVLEASGETTGFDHAERGISIDLPSAKRLMARARLKGDPVDLAPEAFVDRQGELQLPYPAVERLARAFAAAEPDTILMWVDDCETRYRLEGNEPGSRYMHDALRERIPVFAIMRQWAGHDQEIASLRAEVDRLRSLVNLAIAELKAAKRDAEARRLERALHGM